MTQEDFNKEDYILPLQVHPNKIINLLIKEFDISPQQIHPPVNPLCPVYELTNPPVSGNCKPSVTLFCTCLPASLINEYVSQNPQLKDIWKQPGVPMYPRTVGKFTRFTSHLVYYWRIHLGGASKKFIQDILTFPFTMPEYQEQRRTILANLDQKWVENFKRDASYMVEPLDPRQQLREDVQRVYPRPGEISNESSDGEINWLRFPPIPDFPFSIDEIVEPLNVTADTRADLRADISSIIQASTSAISTEAQIRWSNIANNLFNRQEE